MTFGGPGGCGRRGYIDVDGDLCLGDVSGSWAWFVYRVDFARFLAWLGQPGGPFEGAVGYRARFREDGSLLLTHAYDRRVAQVLEPDEVGGLRRFLADIVAGMPA